MKTFTIGWLNKCRCGNKSHTVKTARGNESALWDDDAVKCNSCGRGGVIQICEGQERVLWETDEEMADGKPMSTITREQLRARAREKVKSLEFSITQTAFADSRAELEEELELARIALASLEAEAVAYIFKHPAGRLFWALTDESNKGQSDVMPVYTAPPAPVSVPDEDLLHMAASAIDDLISNKDRSGAGVWADIPAKLRRAAMLQGAVGNSPVIPDGYVLVPVEPTEDMIVEGFESEPDESFSDEKEWEAYDAMSGCQQAAHRARLCWAAMISAAPKPDVR